jgi:hypothetical protein
MKIMADTRNSRPSHFSKAEPCDLRTTAEDLAIACGYTPIRMALGDSEWIIDMVNICDGALALTNAGTTLYITDFYGDTAHALVPNVCRELPTVCENENHRIAFIQALRNRELEDSAGWADHSPVIKCLYDILGISPGELRAT